VKIRVLGASGSEVPGHNCPAYLIDGVILLDAGTVAMSLNIREESRLSHVLLSHAHFDHVKGLPFLFDNLALRGGGQCVTVAGARNVIGAVRADIFNDRTWPDFSKIPSARSPVARFRPLPSRGFVEIDGYRVEMERVTHAVPGYGFIVTGPCGGSVAYTGDTGPTERFWKRMRGRDIGCLIVECSFPDRMETLARVSGHLTPSLLAGELAKIDPLPRTIAVTHLKPQLAHEIVSELESLRLPGLRLPVDGETLEVRLGRAR
jgi:ribonuclease BN (tRNA processing enzyme)